MSQAQTPLELTLHLSKLIFDARRSVALSANLALQLSYAEGPHRSVPAPVVSEALSLLTEQLEDAEQAVAMLEALLQEPESGAAPTETPTPSTEAPIAP